MENIQKWKLTVGQLAKLLGIKNRTLHYYDEIGLFSPNVKGENGYRYYVQYAEKQSHDLYHLMEVYDKTQESGNGSDRIQSAIKDHYQYLAEVVIQERKKG